MKLKALLCAALILSSLAPIPANAQNNSKTRVIGGLTWMASPPATVEVNSKCTSSRWKRNTDGFTTANRVDLHATVLNAQNLPSSVTESGMHAALNAAIAVWNDEINACARPDLSTFTFRTSQPIRKVALPEDDGLNTVLFNDGLCDSPTHVACVYTYSDPSSSTPSGWDIVLNPQYPWGFGRGPWLDVQNVLTHEFGHVVGLGDIGGGGSGCPVEHLSLTMFGCTWPGDTTKRVLALGDSLGLEEVSRA